MDSQLSRIYKALRDGEELTAIKALRDFQCFRLAARIYDLTALGIKVERRYDQRNGKRYAVYYLPHYTAWEGRRDKQDEKRTE